MALIRVTRVEEVPEGYGRRVEIGSQALTVFRKDGRFYVCNSICPHRNGPLAWGELEARDGACMVVCPWHYYRFRLDTGACSTVPRKRLKTYPVVIREGEVCIEVGERVRGGGAREEELK